ncbi:MAG: hypothetical protein M0035_05105 [Actinomycetota bacterium]|nr:hypothetical protein [Actinomycetota bacterium]
MLTRPEGPPGMVRVSVVEGMKDPAGTNVSWPGGAVHVPSIGGESTGIGLAGDRVADKLIVSDVSGGTELAPGTGVVDRTRSGGRGAGGGSCARAAPVCELPAAPARSKARPADPTTRSPDAAARAAFSQPDRERLPLGELRSRLLACFIYRASLVHTCPERSSRTGRSRFPSTRPAKLVPPGLEPDAVACDVES